MEECECCIRSLGEGKLKTNGFAFVAHSQLFLSTTCIKCCGLCNGASSVQRVSIVARTDWSSVLWGIVSLVQFNMRQKWIEISLGRNVRPHSRMQRNLWELNLDTPPLLLRPPNVCCMNGWTTTQVVHRDDRRRRRFIEAEVQRGKRESEPLGMCLSIGTY